MATCPEAVSGIIIGRKKGLSRRDPRPCNFSNSVDRFSMPPTPVPMTTPTRSALSALMVSLASSRACRVSDHGKLNEAIQPSGLFGVEMLFGCEPLDLASDLCLEGRGIETGDPFDARAPFHQGRPGDGHIVAHRSQGPQAGDHYGGIVPRQKYTSWPLFHTVWKTLGTYPF